MSSDELRKNLDTTNEYFNDISEIAASRTPFYKKVYNFFKEIVDYYKSKKRMKELLKPANSQIDVIIHYGEPQAYTFRYESKCKTKPRFKFLVTQGTIYGVNCPACLELLKNEK